MLRFRVESGGDDCGRVSGQRRTSPSRSPVFRSYRTHVWGLGTFAASVAANNSGHSESDAPAGSGGAADSFTAQTASDWGLIAATPERSAETVGGRVEAFSRPAANGSAFF